MDAFRGIRGQYRRPGNAMTRERVARIASGLARLLRYRRADFRDDFTAGLSVAAVAVSVSVAYAALASSPSSGSTGAFSRWSPMRSLAARAS
jgi:hypothetical protein